MKKEKYTIADLALMTHLTQRTIRNYISEGRLKGEKINGAWSFTQEEIDSFFGDRFIQQGLLIKNQAMVDDFMKDRKKKRAASCMIFDVPVLDYSESEEICNQLLHQMNQPLNQMIKMSYHYDQKHKQVRIILVGDYERIGDIINKLPH